MKKVFWIILLWLLPLIASANDVCLVYAEHEPDPEPPVEIDVTFQEVSISGPQEYGILWTMPQNFCSGECRLLIDIKLDNTKILSDHSTRELRHTTWANVLIDKYSSDTWWYISNFVIDIYPYFMVQIAGGTPRISIYDGDPNIPVGGFWTLQNYNSATLLDGKYHTIEFERTFTGTNDSTYSLYVDGVLIDTVVSSSRNNLWNYFSNTQPIIGAELENRGAIKLSPAVASNYVGSSSIANLKLYSGSILIGDYPMNEGSGRLSNNIITNEYNEGIFWSSEMNAWD